MPERSSAMRSDSLSVPGTEMLSTCAARGAFAACTTASGIVARSAACSLSRSAPRRLSSSSISSMVSSAARASPTAAATFSVPGRWPRFCEPPCCSGSSGEPRRMYSAPMPLGAPILWPENAK